MPFALDSNPDISEVSDAINYLLANYGGSVSASSSTGEITGPTGTVTGYLYKYIAIKYADSFDGSLNFSNSPTGRSYYGARNSNDASESSSPADYIWNKVSGGFGTTKFLWYISTGGRQIQFAVQATAPDTGWVLDGGASIDLDVVTSGNIPVIAEQFTPYFTPSILQVPRTGSPLAPVFTGVTPTLYSSNQGVVVPFVDAQTDSNVGFTNNTWRIGNSSTTGYGDISKTNITIGDPTDGGDYAVWPAPTAMPSSPAYITAPVRYKNSLGVITQAGVATLQLIYGDPGPSGTNGTNGTNGSNGTNGTRTAILDVYQWAASAPTTFPVGTSTFTWATGQFTAPATLNGWSLTPSAPVAGYTLWIARTVYADNLTTATSSVTWNATVANATSAAGIDGANGTRTAFLEVYQWAATTPTTFPSGTSTYTWATGAFTAPTTPNSWNLEPGASTPGYKLYGCSVRHADSDTTATTTVNWITSTAYVVGAAGTNGTNGTNGASASAIDISGFTSFTQNAGGAYTPANTTLSAILSNVSSPTYAWSFTGATPTSSTASSVLITPTSSALSVVATLTVNGSNLSSTLSKTITMPIVYNGSAGQAGANGVMSAFPTIYIWTGSSTPPTRPTTTSTYTWSGATYTAPSGWATTAPSNTTPGNYLWSITVPLNTIATTSTSTLDWTDTANPIRSIAYNGVNGSNGTNGVNGGRTAILDMYQWSVSAPTLFPSGNSTYTWATAQFTLPGTPNGWYLTPPASVLGQTLWVARTVYADNNTTSTTSIAWTASTAFSLSSSGVNGSAGSNGVNGYRTAFLELYKWSPVLPNSFPAGNSTYTWANGVFTLPTTPNGWSLTPGASTPGYILYGCAVTYADTNTTTTSVITWNTGTAYAVGAAGTNGLDGANGTNGANGSNGSNGSATFVVVRAANDSSAPTDAEVISVIGRTPVAGDIVTVSYNNYNNATIYRYTISWILFTTYITGSLIVENTITASKMVTGVMSADNTLTRGLTVRDNSGNVLLAAGTPLNYSNITASSNWLNSNISLSPNGTLSGAGGGAVTIVGLGYTGSLDANNTYIDVFGKIQGVSTGSNTYVANNAISINSNGTLSNAGGGQVTTTGIGAINIDLSNAPSGILNSNVTLGTLGAGGFAYLSQITSANVTTYISGAAIGTAQVGVLTAGNIGAGTIDATKIAANTITGDKIAANTVTASNINSNYLTIRDGSGNVLLGAGTPLNYANITAASNWLNSNITISGGAITGIGTGSGTAVANSAISINNNGTLSGAGSGAVTIVGLGYSGALDANNTYIDVFGKIQGVSSGSNTIVDNTQIAISGGTISGIGNGNNTAVANNAISINANGTLTGAGSGAVTPAGINAVNVNLSNAPAGILNSSVTLGTLGAGGFAYLSQITSANVSTYISGAAIGTAQVGVLTAGNIGAGTIDATKIAVNQLSAINANLGTITAGSLNINSKFIVDTSGNATIQSGTSGARLLMQNNVIKVYDSSGVLRVQIGDLTA